MSETKFTMEDIEHWRKALDEVYDGSGSGNQKIKNELLKRFKPIEEEVRKDGELHSYDLLTLLSEITYTVGMDLFRLRGDSNEQVF